MTKQSVEITPEEIWLQRAQNTAWQGTEGESFESWTPLPVRYLLQVRKKHAAPRLLIPGCGSGREIEIAMRCDYKQIVGFDVSESAVEMARQHVAEAKKRLDLSKANVHLFVGDILELRENKELKEDYFDVVLLVGVCTNLLGSNLEKAFLNIAPFMKYGSHLMISDFLITQDWSKFGGPKLRRYLRDAGAIHILTGSGGRETEERLQGIVVVRPGGIPSDQAIQLSSEQVADYIWEGNFGRFAQHRRIEKFEEPFNQFGFSMENWQAGLAVPVGTSAKDMEKESLINLQILARKIW